MQPLMRTQVSPCSTYSSFKKTKTQTSLDHILRQLYRKDSPKSWSQGGSHRHNVFLHLNNITKNRRKYITYGRIFVYYSPPKDDMYSTLITVGGKFIKYPGEFSTQTADLITETLLFNSNISTPEARFMCCNINNFYLVAAL